MTKSFDSNVPSRWPVVPVTILADIARRANLHLHRLVGWSVFPPRGSSDYFRNDALRQNQKNQIASCRFACPRLLQDRY